MTDSTKFLKELDDARTAWEATRNSHSQADLARAIKILRDGLLEAAKKGKRVVERIADDSANREALRRLGVVWQGAEPDTFPCYRVDKGHGTRTHDLLTIELWSVESVVEKAAEGPTDA